ncbi:MAG: hypothetical protein MUF87_03350 [Anaerolineae bacterium]|jgi:hypothetical protein|nr:hypothetical protein [Anaerolineae bacterium]
MVLDKPKLIYTITVERQRYLKRFFWNLLALVAAFGAWVALNQAGGRGIADPLLIQVGEILALGVVALFFVRGIFNLWRWLTRRKESIQFFDRGFIWQQRGIDHKYKWTQVKSFREGVRPLRIGPWVIATLGAQTLTMGDNRAFRITAVHGDVRLITSYVRPYIADVIGERIARALRENKAVQLHPSLIMHSAGLQIGRNKIRWEQVDVEIRGDRLLIKKLNDRQKFKVFKTFNIRQIDNLGGFLEVANITIQNHQPHRFNIKVQGIGY